MDARDFFGYKHSDEEPGRRPETDDEADAGRPPLFEEAVTLDDPAAIQRIDPADMLGRIAELPRQLAQARRIAAAVELADQHRDVDAVAVLALGSASRLLVGVLVAEEVASVHQVAATVGCSAPAIRRPSARSASTSSGERAST